MKFMTSLSVIVLASLAVLGSRGASETVTSGQTVISINDLDCPSCAKKVAKMVSAVPGVASVKMDLKVSAAIVTAHKKAPSPRALWEAVEKAGFQPSRLEGPSGKFTSKPQS